MKRKYKESNLGVKAIALFELGIMFIVMLSITCAKSLQNNVSFQDFGGFALYSGVYLSIALLVGITMGLYDGTSRNAIRGMIRRVALTHLISSGVTLMVAMLMNYNPVSLLSVVAIGSINTVLLSWLRFNVMNSGVKDLGVKRTLILGAGNKVEFIQRRMRRKVDYMGIDIVGYVVVNGDSLDAIAEEDKITLNGSLSQFAIKNDIHQIVLAASDEQLSDKMDELVTCKLQGIAITPVIHFIEKQLGAIYIDALTPRELVHSTGFDSKHKLYKLTNWFIDVSLSFILLMLVWPVMLITAILIKLEDGWNNPVFYKQVRVGENGKEFKIFKFRSMITDAEKNGAVMAAKNDARVTRVGAKIRKYRIDELPQAINVLRGEMSFVGPRPERPVFVNKLITTIPYYHERHNIKPGLTGWAQLKYPYGENENDSLEKLRFDLYYLKHRSLLLDLLILMRTVEVVLFGKGR